MYILTGGPDWPTSVLCGVLRLPLIPIQIGTSPIIIPVALTVGPAHPLLLPLVLLLTDAASSAHSPSLPPSLLCLLASLSVLSSLSLSLALWRETMRREKREETCVHMR